MKENNIKRVAILDVVRVVAVVMVMIGHYCNFYTGMTPLTKELMDAGAYGVPLFFIISGFVIYSTLERTANYKEFIIKRFIRLSPAMFICSTITFVFFKFFYTGEGYEHSKQFINYIIANTFIDPHVFNLWSGNIKYYYIDNAYWSLWVEICFYSLIGFLYFLSKKKFISYYVVICGTIMPIFFLFYSSVGASILREYFSVEEEKIKYYHLVGRAFVFFYECLWFLLGIYLYKLFHNKENKKYIFYILLLFFANIIRDRFSVDMTLFSIITFIFLMIFVYRPQWLDFACRPILCKIGIASYAMYLIHYHLGVVFVKYCNGIFGQSYIPPIIAVLIVIAFGLFCYNYLEKNLVKVYKKFIKI